MNVAVFSSKPYDRLFLENANAGRHQLKFLEPRLTPETVALADGHDAVCVFVHDDVNAEVIRVLGEQGCKLIALRCAGFNNVDLARATETGISVVRVPAYSPTSVAEHAAGLILTLNRKFHRAYNRVREGNFSLDGLAGFDMAGKTVGVIGTGKIGQAFVRIMLGFGCRVLLHDPFEVDELIRAGATYVDLSQLYAESDMISLHCPLLPDTHHLIDVSSLTAMKDGVMIINTSRGALVNTHDAIEAIKSGKIGALGLDVYEEEGGIFFENMSDKIIDDDLLMRLLTFPNVLITSHQAFFTREALQNIAHTTLENIGHFAENGECPNRVKA